MSLENILSFFRNAGKSALKVVGGGYLILRVLTSCYPNNAPVIASEPVTQINEGQSYSYDVEATDLDTWNVLTYSLTQKPEWLSIESSTGLISGTAPLVEVDTEYPVSVKVFDGAYRDNVAIQDYEVNVINVPPANEPPDTTVTKEFSDDGKVKYIFSGTDDGSIDHIAARFNNTGNYQNFDNDAFALIPIIQGNNEVEAIAYDNLNLADPTPATDSFVSPTEEDAKEFMGQVLSGRSGTYGTLERDVLVSIGESDSFYVDYLVRKIDGTDAIINYTGYVKNLETELSNKGLLDSYGIPNLYLVRVPETEIQSRTNSFIDRGYTD